MRCMSTSARAVSINILGCDVCRHAHGILGCIRARLSSNISGGNRKCSPPICWINSAASAALPDWVCRRAMHASRVSRLPSRSPWHARSCLLQLPHSARPRLPPRRARPGNRKSLLFASSSVSDRCELHARRTRRHVHTDCRSSANVHSLCDHTSRFVSGFMECCYSYIDALRAAGKFFSSKTPTPPAAVSPGGIPAAIPAASVNPFLLPPAQIHPEWPLNIPVSMHVYLTTDSNGQVFERKGEDASLPHFVWHDISLGDWGESRTVEYDIKIPEVRAVKLLTAVRAHTVPVCTTQCFAVGRYFFDQEPSGSQPHEPSV